MNSQEAKRILIAYRPGIDSASEPETKEALRLAENDPELRQWLEHQYALHDGVRAHLRKLSVPPDLKWQILAGRKVVVSQGRRREFFAVAAAAVAMLALSAFWLWRPGEKETFAAFRSRMVGFALREYRMDIMTKDATRIRQYLADKGAPADYAITRGLEAKPVIGGAKLSWQGHPVSMICFSASTNGTLYLFVLDRRAVREGKVPVNSPEIISMHGLNAADWSRGDKFYLLAAPGERTELQELLRE